MLHVQVDMRDGANAGTEADSLWGMTERKTTAETRATAGPSTPLRFAQDDRFVGAEGEKRLRAKTDSLRGMTERATKARTRRKATAKTRATAGPSTAQVAKGATCSAQDDSMFEFVQEDGAQDDSFCVDVNRAKLSQKRLNAGYAS
jgi:hypothetical protein